MLFVCQLSATRLTHRRVPKLTPDNFTCCHTEIECGDHDFCLRRLHYTDTDTTSKECRPEWELNHNLLTRSRALFLLSGQIIKQKKALLVDANHERVDVGQSEVDNHALSVDVQGCTCGHHGLWQMVTLLQVDGQREKWTVLGGNTQKTLTHSTALFHRPRPPLAVRAAMMG